MIKTPFALKGDALIHISEASSGLSDYICPSCGDVLIAKKGNIRAHYFAHKNVEMCNNGLETALHMYTKQLIESEKKFWIPQLTYNFHATNKHWTLLKPQLIEFERIDKEKTFSNIRADIVGYIKNVPLIIEVCVTHPVDSDKLNKIKTLDISTIELILDKDVLYDNDKLKNAIIGPSENKKWLYNRKSHEFMKKLYYNNPATEPPSKCKYNRHYKKSTFCFSCTYYYNINIPYQNTLEQDIGNEGGYKSACFYKSGVNSYDKFLAYLRGKESSK